MIQICQAPLYSMEVIIVVPDLLTGVAAHHVWHSGRSYISYDFFTTHPPSHPQHLYTLVWYQTQRKSRKRQNQSVTQSKLASLPDSGFANYGELVIRIYDTTIMVSWKNDMEGVSIVNDTLISARRIILHGLLEQ